MNTEDQTLNKSQRYDEAFQQLAVERVAELMRQAESITCWRKPNPRSPVAVWLAAITYAETGIVVRKVRKSRS